MSEYHNNCKQHNEDCKSGLKPLSKLQTWLILLLVAAVGIFFAVRNSDEQQNNFKEYHARFTYPCMGTIVDITFFEPEIAEKAAKAVYNELLRFENMCNIFNPESEISRLNASAADKPFVCSNELYALLKYCQKAYKITEGTFDITAKNLMDLWGFYRKRSTIPSPAEIKNALAKTGLDKVIFNDDDKSVYFTVKGMAFDLGGIAKGAALDNAVAAAKNAGAAKGIINLGGNIGCFGSSKIYDVGIRHPQKHNEIAGKIFLADAFCATSGDYERFVTINGRKYSHIMNPLTGYPAENIYSATVVSSKGIDSDIFSTACFILGKDKTQEFTDSQKINEAILIFPAENNSVQYSYIYNHITKR